MIRKITLCFLVLCLIACGGSDSSVDQPIVPPAQKENSEPGLPTLIYPSEDLLCTESTLEFKWNAAADPDNDPVSYEIEIASDEQFNNVFFENNFTVTSNVVDLEKGLVYYWRVKALDDKGNESEFTAVWRFYTQGDATSNQLPILSEEISPNDGQSLTALSTTLQWSASDTNDDTLTYDLYFGTDMDPSLLESGLTSDTYDITLQGGNVYYWKVIVEDANGGAAISPIWSFQVD